MLGNMVLSHACVAGAVVFLAGGALRAQATPDSVRATAPSRQARRFCWQGRPMDRCRAFALLELTAQSHLAGSSLDPAVTRPGFGYSRWDDGLSSHGVADIGAMVNVGAHTAVGGTLTAGAIADGGRPVNIAGATVRYRQWLTPSISADAGAGILRMPVGIVVENPWGPGRKNVVRPALIADARLGFRDLVSATGRLMVATDGQGRTHHAIFIGASVGSKVTAAMAATFIAWGIFLSPRGDHVTGQ